MYELKKMERYLRVNLTGPEPSSYEKWTTEPRSHKGWETLCYSSSWIHTSTAGFDLAEWFTSPSCAHLVRGTPRYSPLHAKMFFMGRATGSWRRSFTSCGVEMDLGTSNPLFANDLIPWYFGTATTQSTGCRFVKICATPIYIECTLHVWDSKDKLLRLWTQTLN